MLRTYGRPAISLSAALFLLLAVFCISTNAQNSNSNTNSEANAAAAPTATPIPLSAIIAESQTASDAIQASRNLLTTRANNQDIDNGLTQQQQTIDKKVADAEAVLVPGTSLEDIRRIELEWQSISSSVESWKSELQKQSAVLDNEIASLTNLKSLWDMTLASLENSDPDDDVPAEIKKRVSEIATSIAQTRQSFSERRAELLALQSRLSDLETKVTEMTGKIRQFREEALSMLFVQDRPALWNANWKAITTENLAAVGGSSFSAQYKELREYANSNLDRFILHAIVFILLVGAFIWTRRNVTALEDNDPNLEAALSIFNLPIVASLVLTGFLYRIIYPESPQMLATILSILFIIPAAILLRRIVDSSLSYILYILIGLFFIDLVRETAAPLPLISRLLFLGQMLFALGFLLWFGRSKRFADKIEVRQKKLFDGIKKIIPIALFFFAAALIANIFGYAELSYLIGNAMLRAAYTGLVLYIAVKILESLLVLVMRVSPFSQLNAVKFNRILIRKKFARFIKWVAIFLWIVSVLVYLSIDEAVISAIDGILSHQFDIRYINFSIGDILFIFFIGWITLQISKFLRFILEEDIYPSIDIGGGVSYAVSTLLHYTILVAGFMFLVAALGIDFTKFAVVAGAVGIGIGFGLQNIINNFVSGLILLFERPVKVGDTVQISDQIGQLVQIGLRASVLKKSDGSEVIIPNSQLISERVQNRTVSDRRKLVEIPFSVAYGSDTDTVVELIRSSAVGKPDILDSPEPSAIFTGFDGNALNFMLRFWTGDTAGWLKVQSERVKDVYAALNEAGIEMPSTGSDLHLKIGPENPLTDQIKEDLKDKGT